MTDSKSKGIVVINLFDKLPDNVVSIVKRLQEETGDHLDCNAETEYIDFADQYLPVVRDHPDLDAEYDSAIRTKLYNIAEALDDAGLFTKKRADREFVLTVYKCLDDYRYSGIPDDTSCESVASEVVGILGKIEKAKERPDYGFNKTAVQAHQALLDLSADRAEENVYFNNGKPFCLVSSGEAKLESRL